MVINTSLDSGDVYCRGWEMATTIRGYGARLLCICYKTENFCLVSANRKLSVWYMANPNKLSWYSNRGDLLLTAKLPVRHAQYFSLLHTKNISVFQSASNTIASSINHQWIPLSCHNPIPMICYIIDQFQKSDYCQHRLINRLSWTIRINILNNCSDESIKLIIEYSAHKQVNHRTRIIVFYSFYAF